MRRKKKEWKRVSFSISTEVVHVLDKMPRNEVPNKSVLVEQLLRGWLHDHDQTISGSLNS